MRSRKWVGRLGLVLLLAGVVFLGQGWRSPRPVRAAATAAKIKIMPLGDSITSGTDANYQYPLASYRCELLRKLVSTYNVDFVGSVHGQWGILSQPQTPLPAYCTYPNSDWDEEGHSGWRIDDILNGAPQSWPGNLQSWATAAMPDVVLIHLGTVDFIKDQSVNSTLAEMGQVIDTLRAVNPWVRIVLAKIIPASNGGVNGPEIEAIPHFNDQLPALVASKLRPASPILLVDMYSGFKIADYTVDGVHPNPSGENLLAGRWKDAIDAILAVEVIKIYTFIPLVVK